MIARPSATRCCWPPESCDGLRVEQLREARAGRRRASGARAMSAGATLRTAGRTRCSRRPRGAETARSSGTPSRCCAAPAADAVTSRPPMQDAPAVGLLEPGDQAQRRRLAAAGRAEQHVERAVVEREREPVDGAHLAVGGRPVLADVLGGDGRHDELPGRRDVLWLRRADAGGRAPAIGVRRVETAAHDSTAARRPRRSRSATAAASAEQRRERRAGVGRAHERLADEERVRRRARASPRRPPARGCRSR